MVWLFAAGCVFWVGVFAYLGGVSRRQKAIDERIEGMRTKLEAEGG